MSKKFFAYFLFIPVFFFNFTFAQDLPTADSASTGEENIFLQRTEVPKTEVIPSGPIAQVNAGRSAIGNEPLSCPYAFERDLFVGSKGEDVRLMQKLLNSDKRTIISLSGPGSIGKESDTFGVSARSAVKKFQALFIEYVGIANGRFGPRTRTVMNAICNGDYFNNEDGAPKGTVYNSVPTKNKNLSNGDPEAQPEGEIVETPEDEVAPKISLSANVNTVDTDMQLKVFLNASEEIKKFDAGALILDGGIVKDVRKLSKTNYVVVITPNEDAKFITMSVEADKIEDTSGNLNEYASNEIAVKVNIIKKKVDTVATTPTTDDTASISSILDKIISTTPTLTGSTTTTLGNSQNQTYDCYGQKIPVSQPCQYNPAKDPNNLNPYTNPNSPYNNPNNPNSPAGQQAQQDRQLGQLLGNLLRGNQFGGQSPFGGQQPPSGPGSGPGGQQPPAGPAAPVTPPRTPDQVRDAMANTEMKFVKCDQNSADTANALTSGGALTSPQDALIKDFAVNDEAKIRRVLGGTVPADSKCLKLLAGTTEFAKYKITDLLVIQFTSLASPVSASLYMYSHKSKLDPANTKEEDAIGTCSVFKKEDLVKITKIESYTDESCTTGKKDVGAIDGREFAVASKIVKIKIDKNATLGTPTLGF